MGKYVDEAKGIAQQMYRYLKAEISYQREFIIITKKIMGKYIELDTAIGNNIILEGK
ncbi:MAG: hypothetical protein ACK5LZ_06760 [Anaerorhabdus sp.]